MQKFILCLILTLTIACISGCGDDDTNPVIPGETSDTLYSNSLFEITCNDTGFVNIQQFINHINSVSGLDSIQISFTGETNIDTSLGYYDAFVKLDTVYNNQVYTVWSAGYTNFPTNLVPLNGNFEYKISLNNIPINWKINLGLIISRTFTFQNLYLRFRNFVVIKL